MRTLVLGLGNDLYGDDGVGLYLVNSLRAEFAGQRVSSSSIDFLASTSTGLALLDLVTGYDRLIIIDTIKLEKPKTGTVRVLEEKDLRAIPGPSPHYLSFPQVLAIGRAAGLLVPKELTIIAIEAKNIYHLGEGLSPEMEAKLPEILSRIKSILGLDSVTHESKRNRRS
ncbi:MAG: hydrogenase maturation protease [Candidatus Aminicenantales bacterium]